MKKQIKTKTVNGVRYDLVLFEGDHVYVIYKWDSETMRGVGAQVIPEVARFSLKEDALDYLQNIA